MELTNQAGEFTLAGREIVCKVFLRLAFTSLGNKSVAKGIAWGVPKISIRLGPSY